MRAILFLVVVGFFNVSLAKSDSLESLLVTPFTPIPQKISSFPMPDLKAEGQRNYDEIWVRQFPILSAPYADPYPLTKNSNELWVSNPKGLSVYRQEGNKMIARGKRIYFNFLEGHYKVDGRTYPLDKVEVHSLFADSFLRMVWDREEGAQVGVEVRGKLVFRPVIHKFKEVVPVQREALALTKELEVEKEILSWSALNVLSLDEYLYSVVPSEVPTNWHVEALRAQSIAARTYALFEMIEAREVKGRVWDVDPTTWFQSYRGVRFWSQKKKEWLKKEASSTTKAVQETWGQGITHKGEIIKAYFSSNSGGLTCTATECFQLKKNPEYLLSVPDAPGVKEINVTGTWGKRANITRETIKAKLAELGFSADLPVHQIKSFEKGPTGRTWRLAVELRDPLFPSSEIFLTRKQTKRIMSLFGPIRSFLYQLFPVDRKGQQKIIGHGYGHGVGMSQWGAELFARQGKNAKEILTHYYSSTKIEKLYE